MRFTMRLQNGSADDLRDLWSWLAAEEVLRGRVAVAERPPEPGALGPVADALVATLAPGGAVVVLIGALTRWLRYRRGDLTVTIERDAEKVRVQISATRVRGLDQAGMTALVREATDALANDDSTPSLPGVRRGKRP
jgi:hypothetical protein